MKRFQCLILVSLYFLQGLCQIEDRKAMRYFNEGLEKVYRNNYKDAVVDFSWAIMRDSGFLQAYENRGVVKYYLKDFSGAIEDFDKALEINNEDYNTFGRRGWAKFHIQDFTGAIDDFTRAIEGLNDNTLYYNGRGEAKYYLGDYKGAIADFSKVIRLWTNQRVHRRFAFYWRGMAKIELNQKESACLDFYKAWIRDFEMAYDMIDIYCW